LKEIINLTIITPVHNEGKTIFKTISEFFEYYKNSHIKIKFIISEDGSTDNSVEEIKRLQKIYDIYLISEKERKGYAQAVVDAFTLLDTNIACFIDSDGQCDPADLIRLLDKFDRENIVVGNRKPRSTSTYLIYGKEKWQWCELEDSTLNCIEVLSPSFDTSNDAREWAAKFINEKNTKLNQLNS